MSKFWIIGFVFLAGTSYAAAQTDAPASPPAAQQDTTANVHPWTKAEAVLRATATDAHSGGIMAVEPHVPDLEQALVDGKAAFAPPAPGDTTVYVLTDGTTNTLLSLLTAATAGHNAGVARQTIAIRNPYPQISLYLGSYYNEVGKHDDALRVLDEGIALRSEPDMGDSLPDLISERGAALETLKRWDDALADYDKGLAIAQMADDRRARLYRGRGFVLTELNRLDEAEEAYNTSLKLAPDNSLAQNELRYIARLKAGGQKAPTQQFTVQVPPSNPQ
jgi:tetratricopeptide (TPR) repeat protein